MSVSIVSGNLPPVMNQVRLTPDEAASKIQKTFRNFQARGGLFAYGVRAIKERQYEQFQRASAGATPVYFHNRLALVLKNCPKDIANDRLERMLKAQELCNQKQFDRLVIPKAKIYRNWMIETELPIVQSSLDEMYLNQMILYSSNPYLFDEAVSQFCHFCCHTYFSDLCGGMSSLQVYSPLTPLPRYDNIMLFYDQKGKAGKIGLPDLEHCIVLNYTDPTVNDRKDALCDIIRFFPYHDKQILEIAKEYIPASDFETFKESLIKSQKESLRFYQTFLIDRLSFLRENGVTLENPRRFCLFSTERTKELQRAVERDSFFLDGQEKYIPALIEKMIQILEEYANKEFQKKPATTIQQLLVQRNVIIPLQIFAENCISLMSGVSLLDSGEIQNMILNLLKEMAETKPDGSFGELGFFHHHQPSPFNKIPHDYLQIFY